MAKATLFGSWTLVAGLLVASAFSHSFYRAAATLFLIGLVLWFQEKLLSRWISYPTPKDIFERHPLARPSIFVYMALMTGVFLYHFLVAPLAIFSEPTAFLLVAMILSAGLAPTLLVQYYAFKEVAGSRGSRDEAEPQGM